MILEFQPIPIIKNTLLKKHQIVHQKMMKEKNSILRREKIDLKIEVDLKLLNLKNLEKIEIKIKKIPEAFNNGGFKFF